MSMTREETIKILNDEEIASLVGKFHGGKEALDLAISVLRPVSREQVERMFLGCDFCKIELDDFPYIVAHSDYSSSDTCYEPSFCPICGKPLTDEAVQMVMERLEALHETVE